MELKQTLKILAAIAFTLLLFGSAAAMAIPAPSPGSLIPVTTLTVQPATGGENADSITVKDNSGLVKGISYTGSLVITGIQPGTYTVEAVKAGYSKFTQTVVIPVTNPQPVTISYALAKVSPLPPSDLTATVIAATSVQLNWKDNSADEEHYIIYRAGQELQTIPANSVSYVDNTVTEGSTYTYFVRAYDDDTDTYADSNAVSITVQTALAKPALSATILSPTEIKLTWADLPNENSYTLEKKDTAGNFIKLADLAKDTVTYTDTVTVQSSNTYRLTATNQFGTATSSEVTAVTPTESLAVSATIESVTAGETSEINVKVTNWLGYAIENVEGTVTVEDLGLTENVDFGDLAKGASKTVSVDMDVPADTDADDYDVSADLAWENSANNDFDDSFDLGTLDVNVPKHSVQLTDVFLTTTKLNAGDEVKVMLNVKNTGSSTEKVTVKLSNPDLGTETLSLEIPKNTVIPAIIKLEVPEDAKSGSYQLTLSASYSSKTATADKLTISVKGETTVTPVITPVEEPAKQVPLWIVALLVGLGVILAVEVALRAQYNKTVAAQTY
jgi:hypothetical protein